MDKSNWIRMKGSELEKLGQTTVASAILVAEGKEVTTKSITAVKARIRQPKEIIEEEIQL